MDALRMLEGDWRLTRLIDDFAMNRRLLFAGRASFTRDEDGLRYDEEGTWRRGPWAGRRASQRHHWRVRDGAVEVLYRDGRPFHRFDWPGATGSATAAHDCPPDLYDAAYRFHLPGRWELDWKATGPAKNYISRSRFERGGDEAP